MKAKIKNCPIFQTKSFAIAYAVANELDSKAHREFSAYGNYPDSLFDNSDGKYNFIVEVLEEFKMDEVVLYSFKTREGIYWTSSNFIEEFINDKCPKCSETLCVCGTIEMSI